MEEADEIIMRQLVKTHLELCIGCGRCEEQCPVEMANVIYRDKDGQTKIRTDEEICAACGRCIVLCPQNARYYEKEDLS